MASTPGQIVRATGEWINHPKFGEQFKIVRYTTLVPPTVAGIEKYLGSGLIKGIGPKRVNMIAEAWADQKEIRPKKGGFQKNEGTPLRSDLLIIDEASIINTVRMHHLLKAIPVQATLFLAGDANQLPSVGPGNVLKDIIASGEVLLAFLTEIFRQAKGSSIIGLYRPVFGGRACKSRMVDEVDGGEVSSQTRRKTPFSSGTERIESLVDLGRTRR
ncbi:MAG: AAA family ATPase [Desulfomonile tiedjei]|uniref:AAA family ATPase n=1 Tax=Desulfomonile tiedjei TaxID=2358 RepID=A0A9D6V6N3_9BACT|nr:AAA family ATPase [Desulfomonile tiedjei]